MFSQLLKGCRLPFGLDNCGIGLRGGYLSRFLVLVMVCRRLRPGSPPGLSYMSWSLMSLSLLTLWTGPFWIALWGGWVSLTGLEGLTFLVIVRFVLGSNSLPALGSRGVAMVVFTRVVRFVRCSSLPYMPVVSSSGGYT